MPGLADRFVSKGRYVHCDQGQTGAAQHMAVTILSGSHVSQPVYLFRSFDPVNYSLLFDCSAGGSSTSNVVFGESESGTQPCMVQQGLNSIHLWSE